MIDPKTEVLCYVIPADLNEPIRMEKLKLEFFSKTEWSALSSMYPLIGNGCDTVERVRLPDGEKVPGVAHMILWVDECGLMKPDPVFNARASLISNNSLHGNAILTADSGFNTVNLPPLMCSHEAAASLDSYLKDVIAPENDDRFGCFVYNPETDRIID